MEHPENLVVILDYGSQYTQLIARRIRSLNVFSLILPFNTPLTAIKAYHPGAVILSGGPSSVYDKEAPDLDPEILNLDVPLLGICYGMQIMTKTLGGKIIESKEREYGRTDVSLIKKSPLFAGIEKDFVVWMSHGDKIDSIPEGFEIVLKSKNAIGAFENREQRRYGVQFHPEVVHSENGTAILKNFLFNISGLEKNWSMPDFIEHSVAAIRKRVGDKKVVLGLSGGVDSSVLAILLHKALGEQLTCVFVNNGVLRKDEAEKVVQTFEGKFGLNLKYVDASERFLVKLAGIKDPEKKRHIIGKEFVDVFFDSVPEFDYLAQGTLYPDVIESVSTKGPSDKIKTHHNRVDTILELQKEGRILEPFEELFKDEVRLIGEELRLPDAIIHRHPFPGPGLAIRILGEVTLKRLEVLRQADAIFLELIKEEGYYEQLWQAFAVLLPVRSVGVMGDKRTYGYTIAIRAVTSVDGMTADFADFPHEFFSRVSHRIIGEVKAVNRVVYDISSKPPGTIEWE